MHFSKYTKNNNLSFYAVIIIIAVLFSIIYYFTPLLIDDLQFTATYRRFNNGVDNFSLSAWFDYINHLRNLDNSRISNMLSPFSTIISPWNNLFPFISGIVTAGIVWITVKLVDYKEKKAIMASIIWLMIILFLPWRNNILVADYQLNYTYATLLYLSFIILLVKYESTVWSKSKFITMSLLAILAGGWHEGFAFPIAGGLTVWLLYQRFRLSPQWYIIVLIFITAAFIFALSPGIINRATREIDSTDTVNYVKYTADLILVFITLIVILLTISFHKTRVYAIKSFKNPIFIIIFISMILSTLLSTIFYHTARTAFWPEMCAIISLLLFLKPFTKKVNKLFFISVGFTCFFVCTVHACVIINWQIKFYNENKIILSKLNQEQNTVFHDIIMPESVPEYTLYFPTRTHWITAFHYVCLQKVLNIDDISIVPTSLADATISNSIKLDGNMNSYLKNDAIWIDYSINSYDTSKDIYIDITLKDNTILYNNPAYIRQFITCNKDTLLYLKPHKIESNMIKSIYYHK